MPRLSKIGAAALAAFGWSSGSAGVTASYLVVAGGGGGGGATTLGYSMGGGGAGGLLTGTTSLNPTLTYTVTVGAGGAAGSSGSSSIFNAATAIGGGSGGRSAGSNVGANGGSGGGGAGEYPAPIAGGTGTSGQGNNGGTGNDNSNTASGGGGGAGAVGANATTSNVAGAGGNGIASSISGSSVTYAGGGGGGAGYISGNGTGGAGGTGGGGTGSGTGAGTSGTANLGGGGGGGKGTSTSGSGGSGIVIISYAGAQQFGGGVVTSVGGNTIHTFNTSGTLSPLSSLTANFLVIAGGGGGGAGQGSGGGAGGFRTSAGTSGGGASAETALTIDANSIYLVTVGAGGANGAANYGDGLNGNNSVFNAITSIGGGYGIASGGPLTGGTGGSGGGGSYAFGAGGAGTANQGYAGGSGSSSATGTGGGGGGAGQVGANSTTGVGGNGGNGVASSISGSSVTYAGGGGPGAGTGTTRGLGGTGGGGDGGLNSTGYNGTPNTGGGGGGGAGLGSSGPLAGGQGGSGIVIISYAGTQQMAGGTVTSVGGNTIHTFTSSGYLTPIKLVGRSLRFRSSASAYLNRTFGSGNRQTWTWSGWVKRGIVGALYPSNGFAQTLLGVNDSDKIWFNEDKLYLYLGSGATYTAEPPNKYRDPSSWYHVVVVLDTTNATSADRIRMYVNGSRLTISQTMPTQNWAGGNINTAINHNIGKADNSNLYYYDGYMADVNFIDGQALTPSSFGGYSSYGQWQPITYGGSYGTNGFYLPFSNNASTTTLGYDFSPNGNNWTTNNISLTAGSTYDSMTDVPTLTSATAANYAVWNPLDTSSNGTLSRANLQSTSVGVISGKASIAVSSGKWYWEVTCTGGNFSGVGSHIGIDSVTSPCVSSAGTRLGNTTTSYSYNSWNGQKLNNSVSSAYGSTYTNGDVISIALDLDNGKIWWAKNGTFQASGDPAAGTNAAYSGIAAGLYTAAVGDDTGGGIVLDLNCGQRPFTYTPPSGFVAINTYNL